MRRDGHAVSLASLIAGWAVESQPRDWNALWCSDSIWTTIRDRALGAGRECACSCWVRSGLPATGCRQPRGLAAVLATAVVFWTACTLGLEMLGAIGAIASGDVRVLVWRSLSPGSASFAGFGPGSVELLRSGSIDEPFSWDALVGLALVLAAALLYCDAVAASGREGRERRADLSSLLRGAMVEGRPAVPGGRSVRRECGDLFPRQRRSLVHLADGVLGRGSTGQGRSGPVSCSWPRSRRTGVPGRSGRVARPVWSRPAGSPRRRPFLLFSFEPNVDTIFVAGYLLAAYFFLQAFAARTALAALCAWGPWPRVWPWGPKPSRSSSFRRCSRWRSAGSCSSGHPARTKIVRAIVIAVVPLVSGGFWFVRNALLTGNPFYPLEVRLLGPHAAARLVWSRSDAQVPTTSRLAIGGRWAIPCSPSSTPGCPLWLASLAGVWAIKNPKTKATRGWIAAFSLLAVANVALYWAFIPYRTQQRFMLQALGLAVVPLAMTLDRARWLRHLAVVLARDRTCSCQSTGRLLRPGAISPRSDAAD